MNRARLPIAFSEPSGVWAPRKNPKTEKWEDTFSIFTSDPNGVMVKIHDRQPVILEARDYEEWLVPTERPPIHLLRVFPDEKMKMTPVEGDAAKQLAERSMDSLFP